MPEELIDNSAEDSEDSSELRVTWAELFFDLVFVFAVTEVAALLRTDHGWAGVGRAVIVFVPIYWVWVGTCIYANTHAVRTSLDRLAIFALGLCGMFMALAAPAAYHDRGVLFGAAYLTARLILAALVFRGGRLPFPTFTVAVTITGPLLLIGGFTPPGVRVVVWGVAALTDLATPALTRRQLSRIRFVPGHLAERFGGFLIIALGESIVDIGGPAASAGTLTAGMAGAVAAAFVLACALWWQYYMFAASAVRHALDTAQVRGQLIRQVLSYGHLSFVGAIIAVADGVAEVVAHPAATLPTGSAALLFGGAALYLATFGYTRWRMFRQVSKTRLSAAVVVLALLPAAPHLPGLVALCLLVAVLVPLNVLEHILVARASR